MLTVCVCAPMCRSPHVEAWGQLQESLLCYSVGSSNQTQLCGKLPRLTSHLSGYVFPLPPNLVHSCSAQLFHLSSLLGCRWHSHCVVKWMHLKPCLPLSFQKLLIFSSSLMETVSTISSSAEQWCPVPGALSIPIVSPKKDCRREGARQACYCFSLQSAFLLFSECEFWIPPLTPSLPSPWPLMLCDAIWGLVPDLDCLTVSLGIFSIPCGFKHSCMRITIAVLV